MAEPVTTTPATRGYASDKAAVTWAPPGRCAIVTGAAEPRSSRPPSQRHAEHTELDPPPYADRAH